MTSEEVAPGPIAFPLPHVCTDDRQEHFWLYEYLNVYILRYYFYVTQALAVFSTTSL
jgi:hypothetical protein